MSVDDEWWITPNSYLIAKAKGGDTSRARILIERFIEQSRSGKVDEDLLEYFAEAFEAVLAANTPGNKHFGDDIRKALNLKGRYNAHISERDEFILDELAFEDLTGKTRNNYKKLIGGLRERGYFRPDQTDEEIRNVIQKVKNRNS